MLSDHTPMPTLAVSDLARAREFYEGVLGFKPEAVGDVPDGILYKAGNGAFTVYQSAYAGTNKATYMSFVVPVDGFGAEVEGLRAQGVQFQTFDMDTITWDDGVAHWGENKAVWFADPDGNILAVETG